jgi:schlafen family protein
MSEPWTEERIQSYIDGQIEENWGLEYKAAAGLDKLKKDEITKDVSAFANAAGGTIIYGVREFKEEGKKHLPEKIDPVDRREFSKEWLEHIIGNIQPRLNPIIYPVKLSSVDEHVAYVVEISQGTTAHQSTDGRYYKRQNFEVVRMADYEIRDVMQRRTQPRFQTVASIRIKYSSTTFAFYIDAVLLNCGKVTAHEITINFVTPVPVSFGIESKPWQSRTQGDGLTRLVAYDPLHPGDDRRIGSGRMGEGSMPIRSLINLRPGAQFDPEVHPVKYTGEKIDMRFKLFARDYAAVLFQLQFDPSEIRHGPVKTFEPLRID